MSKKEPTHAYIGRKSCGCCLAVATDEGTSDMFEQLAVWTEEGLKMEHVTWERYREVSAEPTFMMCNHGQLKLV